MKALLTCTLFMAIATIAFAQNMPWIRFIDSRTGLAGYKDTTGKVRIKAKFIAHSCPRVFRNIIPVYEEVNRNKQDHSVKEYYLLKSGKIIGIDSVYSFEFNAPQEVDGKILFRDRVSDKVGYFNSEGKVVIPAIYNDASDFSNGLAIAVKNAVRRCHDGKEFSKENSCEHWYWDGNIVLIDSQNQILLENLNRTDFHALDFYSLQVNKTGLDSTYVSFTSVDGRVYSFVDHRKHFLSWFRTVFIQDIGSEKMLNHFSPLVTVPKSKNWKSSRINYPDYAQYAWIKDTPEALLAQNKDYLLSVLNEFRSGGIVSSSMGIGPLLPDDPSISELLAENDRYPHIEAILTDKTFAVKIVLGFVKTKEGYRLIEIHK